jgi:cyclin-dependent kinase regulatory subunit CKS1
VILEEEWRYLGLRMSTGWVNYASHDPEPHILMFRRTHEAGNRARIAAAKREEERRREEEEEEMEVVVVVQEEEEEEEGVGALKP